MELKQEVNRMQDEKFRNKEFIRLLAWIKENSLLWNTICGHKKEDMTMKDFQYIMKMLEEERLYPIMYVFMTVYKKVSYVNNGLEEMFTEMLKRQWQSNKGEEVIDVLIRNLD